jgi:hypothetical protein
LAFIIWFRKIEKIVRQLDDTLQMPPCTKAEELHRAGFLTGLVGIIRNAGVVQAGLTNPLVAGRPCGVGWPILRA